MKRIFAILIVVTTVYLQSCEQQELVVDDFKTPVSQDRDLSSLEDIEEFTEPEKDAIKTILSKSLAKALNDAAIRSLLKEEVMKEFDGDYDILFNSIKHKKVGDISFAQHLMMNLPSLDKRDESTQLRSKDRYDYEAVKAFVKNLDIDTDKMPLLQISVPFYGERWQKDEMIPVAAATDYVVQNHTEGLNIVAYYHDNREVILKSNKQPDFPVMVVGENERLKAVKKSENGRQAFCPLEPEFSDDNYDYFMGDTFLRDCGGGYNPPPVANNPPSNNPSCARDSKGTYAYEQMRNIRFVSMSKLRDAEGWISGKIELRAIVVDYATALSGDQAFTMLFYEKRKEFKTCGILPGSCRTDNYDPKRDIIIWDQDEIGDRILVRFYEDNRFDGSEVNIKIPFKVKVKVGDKVELESGLEVGAKIKLKNKLLGDNYVYYCNSVTKKYDNGFLRFEIRPEGM